MSSCGSAIIFILAVWALFVQISWMPSFSNIIIRQHFQPEYHQCLQLMVAYCQNQKLPSLLCYYLSIYFYGQG